MIVSQFVPLAERFPATLNTRDAFREMSRQCGWEDDTDRLDGLGLSCPEAYRRDGSIGYVFVANGLPTSTVTSRDPLVFFCPAQSHQGDRREVQHCHAVRGNGELFCVSTNAEMFEMLSEDISRGRKGIVPYSEEAIQLMERETKARESFLKSR
jgi:hypothetical protein